MGGLPRATNASLHREKHLHTQHGHNLMTNNDHTLWSTTEQISLRAHERLVSLVCAERRGVRGGDDGVLLRVDALASNMTQQRQHVMMIETEQKCKEQ